MAQLSDFISRIFSADRTQGLSGGAEVVIDQDAASAFYTARLRKHRTEEDLVETPEALWASASFGGRKGGLRAHLHAERGEGIASFTDLLLVLNSADADRISLTTNTAWATRAETVLLTRFEAWRQKEPLALLHPDRAVRVRILADGCPEMQGQSLGLGPGEYVTGLLPNLYVAPGPLSRRVITLHLNLPGVWEGYREVGHLHSDQVLFTLGRHWLDNYSHPALREPGLYRLQQYPDGSLVHVISPEVQDRYLVRSDSTAGGASVLTIAEWTGEPVAYIVLAVVEAAQPADRGGEFDEVEKTSPGARLRPSADGPPADAPRPMLQRTIVPGDMEGRICTLQERGALLQKVHFANFMEGYDVYLGPGGRVATQMPEPKAVLQVRGPRVSLVVMDSGVLVGGRPVATGKPLPLRGEVSLEIDGNRIQYRDLSEVKVEGWPYLAELRRPGTSAYLEFGSVHRIGRDRRCKVRLPDEPHNDNISWLPTIGGGATIRSRTGDIPKSRFYTDSIMVASEHAELDLSGTPTLRSLARHCYTFVRRNAEYFALYPREGVSGRGETELLPNDEVLVGNCLFQVSYVDPNQVPAQASVEAPRVALSPGDLARAMDTGGSALAIDHQPTVMLSPGAMPPLPPRPPTPLDHPEGASLAFSPGPPSVNRDATPVISMPTPPMASRLTVDPVAAFGLGEMGPPPRPVAFERRSEEPRIVLGAPPPLEPAQAAPAEPATAPEPARAASPEVKPSPPDSAFAATGVVASAVAAALGSVAASPPSAPPPAASPPAAEAPARRPPPEARPRAGTRGMSSRPSRGDRRPPPPMIIEDFPGFPVQPSATPPPATAPVSSAPPMPLPQEPEDPVLSVDEATWQLEVSRPAQLVQVGWMVSGEVIIGNHRGCTILLPEVRSFPLQAFLTLDYFRMFVRGRRGRVELLQEGEARVVVKGESVASTEALDDAELLVIRRDANLEPDFDVRLQLVTDPTLPDPRARLLKIDPTERLVRALFTTGFPMRVGRRVRLGPVEATVAFDGATLRISDYLPTYRLDSGGFRPFFWREAGRPFRTAPEDGADIVLQPADALIVGTCVYQFTTG